MQTVNGPIGAQVGQWGGNQASAKPGALAELAERQRGMVAELREIAGRLHQKCDALVSHLPPTASTGEVAKTSDPRGMLDQLAFGLNELGDTLNWLRQAVTRVEEL